MSSLRRASRVPLGDIQNQPKLSEVQDSSRESVGKKNAAVSIRSKLMNSSRQAAALHPPTRRFQGATDFETNLTRQNNELAKGLSSMKAQCHQLISQNTALKHQVMLKDNALAYRAATQDNDTASEMLLELINETDAALKILSDFAKDPLMQPRVKINDDSVVVAAANDDNPLCDESLTRE